MKPICRYCGKSNGIIKHYIIADDLENPKAYHPACKEKFQMEMMIKISNNETTLD